MGKPKRPNFKIKIRKRWKINPKTKIKESTKRYLRTREKGIACKAIKNEIKKST